MSWNGFDQNLPLFQDAKREFSKMQRGRSPSFELFKLDMYVLLGLEIGIRNVIQLEVSNLADCELVAMDLLLYSLLERQIKSNQIIFI